MKQSDPSAADVALGMSAIASLIASDIGAAVAQVQAATDLLDGGATVPFVARYRKEQTGGLSDTQLRRLDERLHYLREMDQRRETIARSIDEQGKLDDTLKAQLRAASSKAELEDLYLPYKKKRRTKGQIAREAGLEPLAKILWSGDNHDPLTLAETYIDEAAGYADAKAVLDGARFILLESFAEDAALIAKLREQLTEHAYLCSEGVASNSAESARFQDYLDHQERYAQVASHRASAMFRGRAEGVLSLRLRLKESEGYGDAASIALVADHVNLQQSSAGGSSAADAWRRLVVTSTWRVKLSLHLEAELLSALRTRADQEAIDVFAANLRDLLLAAPAGSRVTLGLDPGFRTGVKLAVVDGTGKVLDHAAIFPHAPQQQWDRSLTVLEQLVTRHEVELIAVGNGTASRETEQLAAELIARLPGRGLTKVVVSEAGASVYSASELAEQEHPDLDVTIRGAVSIARRLQDPLAELVKIDPRAIGVGQYQHDVPQNALGRSLEATIEDCVNAVGVDLNTASAPLLSHVAGLSSTLASNIVKHRNEHGAFAARKALSKVPRLGPKAYEQAAGFLRIANGDNPLDASAVHPETYPVVTRIASFTGRSLAELIGDAACLKSLDPARFTDEQFGAVTVQDIIRELEKPGRDPRPEFRTARFADAVTSMNDLEPGQILEGQVTNVTAFGAFVDIGVHQDGLVHISALSEQFVKAARDVVKTGDVVKVKVMQVDIERKRIGLSMRLTDTPDASDSSDERGVNRGRQRRQTEKGAGGRRPAGKRDRSENRKRSDTQTSAFADSLKAALDSKSS